MNEKAFSGNLNGKEVRLFELANNNGVRTGIMNYGATLVYIKTPDKAGNTADIVLGYDDLDGYLSGQPFYGKVIGRYANRISNARFVINGKTFQLNANMAPHQLHGGDKGFHVQVWDVLNWDAKRNFLELRYLSKDGEEGFPGNLETRLTFELTEANALILTFQAVTDKTTQVNLTHHSFFNLKGAGSGTVKDHIVKINADYFTPSDKDSITTGEILRVKDSPMDFTRFKKTGLEIDAEYDQLKWARGYDHNYVLRKKQGELACAAEVYEPVSGRAMEVWTNQSGIQFYTGNWIDKKDGGKKGQNYIKHGALCLEPQAYPNTPNHPHFPQSLLQPGETYTHTIIYKFKTLLTDELAGYLR